MKKTILIIVCTGLAGTVSPAQGTKNIKTEAKRGTEGFVSTQVVDLKATPDGDVSERNFSHTYGVAFIPEFLRLADRNNHGGYLNMSESFVRAKNMFIMVHKNGIPAAIRTKLGL